MNLKDLKVGYLVEVVDGRMGIIMPIDKKGSLGICRNDNGGIATLENYNDDLKTVDRSYSKVDIVRVYGYSDSFYALNSDNIKERELLWERGAVKELSEKEEELLQSALLLGFIKIGRDGDGKLLFARGSQLVELPEIYNKYNIFLFIERGNSMYIYEILDTVKKARGNEQ